MSGWYDENFEFIATAPFNEGFEIFGADSMNFMFNSGSINLLVYMLILHFILRKIMFRAAIKFYKS